MAAPVKGSLPVPPRDDWFDRLARTAAGSMSRRDAVGLFAGTTVMAILGSWVRPSRAFSAGRGQGKDPGCSGTRTFYRADCAKKVPKLNYKPPVNGCGPQNGVNLVPQTPLFVATFTPACDEHDRGYGTCNRPKEVTDKKFLDDMKTICAGPGGPVSGLFMNLLMIQCIRNAEIYYTAVSQLGDDPYKEGQAEGCDCCEECQVGRNAGSTATCPNTCPGPNKPCCVAIKYGYHVGGCCRPGEECCIGSNNSQDHPNQMSWCCPTGTCGPAGGKCNRSPCVAK
jgi:hypothetical protein